LSSQARVASSAEGAPGVLGRIIRWIGEPPHPALVCEISAAGVAAARTGHGRLAFDSQAFEPLPEGSVVPSPVELNVAQPAAVQEALARVLERADGHSGEVALVIPDQVVRVFLLQFDAFPKSAEEAIPLLRFRLRKSVPFDAEDTSVGYMRQASGPPSAPATAVHVLAAIARQKIIRQYEELLEAQGKRPGVVISATLATLPLVDDSQPALLARMSGRTLTTVIVRKGILAVYRCTEMPGTADALAPQSLLDEIYPATAYYQDTWGETVAQVRLSGCGTRFSEFQGAIESELRCRVTPVTASAALDERLTGDARTLVDGRMDALVGWMLHRAG
jgi:type IV pilus assembly protein PilM